MPRISVVVPIYNVEAYLRPCLESIAAQTVEDIEVVMVDDGSTDGSRAIAEEFVAADRRFRLVAQPNAGLGAARNTGAQHATGEFLQFVDSDDLLPRNGLRLLLRSLEETGSDFATGNVHRFNRSGSNQAPFLAKPFARTRQKTHITRFRPLLVDRIAPNKLWRRSFWDKHGFAFPVGVTHEDIPVVVPAHFLAKSVDVISDPVYLYRVRETGGLSITQRRLEPKVLMDRLSAVRHVSRFLARPGRRRHKRWYDQSVVAEDLRYYLNVLPHADGAYRQLFLDEVNAFLDTAHRKAIDPQPAIERLKWELVRRRRMDELLEVLRFQQEDMRDTVPVERNGRFYGPYPYLDDPELKLPLDVYELRQELPLVAQIERIRWEGERAHIEGFAYVRGIGAPERGSQRVRLVALRTGRSRLLRRVRRRLPWLGIRVHTEAVHRPELTAASRQRMADVSWAGFHARVSASQLTRLRFRGDDDWQLYAQARVGRITRRTIRFPITSQHPARGADLLRADGVRLRVAPAWQQRLAMELRRRWAALEAHDAGPDGEILLRGTLHGFDAAPKLDVVRREGERVLQKLTYPLERDGDAFTARIPAGDLVVEDRAEHDVEDEGDEEGVRWEPLLAVGRRQTPLALDPGVAPGAWPHAGREVALHRSFAGNAVLVARRPQPVVTEAAWEPGAVLRVRGLRGAWRAPLELVLGSPVSGAQHPFPVAEQEGGAFACELRPAAIETMGGPLPLGEGAWHLWAREPGEPRTAVPVALASALVARLPLAGASAGKGFGLGAMGGDRAVLNVERNLPDGERGPHHQARLRSTLYRERRDAPLREAVVYASFDGRQCSDSPRAIHEELVRREVPLEHLWVVRDGRARVPARGREVAEGSTEHYEAMATARYLVVNDALPAWFERRPDQVVVQTFAGTPIKRVGLDVAAMPPTVRRFQSPWRSDTGAQWQHALSPSPFATPILRRAFAMEGELHETGAPRSDRLEPAALGERSARLRERLGIGADTRVILYAPTYRDHAIDHRGRPRIDLHLDVDALRAALGGQDAVVLFRKHHLVLDPAPSTADGFIRDASAFPDGSELLLAADVLVTDYCSLMVDFAATGRPVVLYAYDLEAYRDDVRGLYVDLEAEGPGPIARTTEELGALLAELPAGPVPDARAAAFARRMGAPADGAATSRAVERIFGV